MQGDLISRSALIEKFKDKSGIWTGTSKYLIQVIEKQPTAYSVEDVVAELEEIYDRIDKQKKEAYEDKDWEKFDLFMHRNEGIYIALAIVRNGGKE